MRDDNAGIFTYDTAVHYDPLGLKGSKLKNDLNLVATDN